MRVMKYFDKLGQYYCTMRQENANAPGKGHVYFDFLRSFVLYGSTISDYFQYRFWEKSGFAKRGFMTARKNNRFYAQVNDLAAREKLNHKATFNRDFAAYLKRDTLAIPGASMEEFKAFAQREQEFFIKPCKLGAGVGVTKFRFEDISDYSEMYQKLSQGEYVIEGCIRQDETMALIHPQSINTVRAITFCDGKEVKVIGAVIRCGAGDSYIDNHSAGGYTAIIDVETGRVISCASSKWKVNVVRHPDTGVVFPGFQIPNWDKAIAMVKEAASSLEGIHYTGWDIAFIPGDVCLVEANPSGDPVVLQEPTQRGVKELYDWMLRELKK